MLSFLVDHNVHAGIVRGIRRQSVRLGLDVDLVTADEVGLAATDDREVLDWAAGQGRVVLTLDINTLVGFAWERVRAGNRMPGVCAIPRRESIGRIVDDVLFLCQCSLPGELDNSVVYLPLS